MKGKVKWFSRDKGYGFITGEDGIDRHFAVRDVVGADLPTDGFEVEFEHEDGSKGARAKKVTIGAAPAAVSNGRQDDRVTCASCGKKMVPRIITGPPLFHAKGCWTPVPRSSICPFCGQQHQKFDRGSGEIVTAVVGVIVVLVLVLVFAAASTQKMNKTSLDRGKELFGESYRGTK